MSRILDKLADQHEQRIIDVLYRLEEDVIKEVTRATGGKLVSQRLAIQLQPAIRNLVETTFLDEADTIINEEYNKIAKEVLDTFGEMPIPKKFKSLTEVDLTTLNALKAQSFSGFEDIAERFLKVINDEVYQSTIAGRPFDDMVTNIRSHINGVYKRSNTAEINELVDFINENKFDSAKKAQVEEAVRKLHTQYASDRAGNNLRRYASQIAHDSVMQFHGQFTVAKAKEAGLNHFTYTGTLVRDSREFCVSMLNKTLTEEQIRDMWNNRAWQGKSTGDPFIVRGGYRCRHTWIPTDPSWGQETVDQVPEEPEVEDNVIDIKSVVESPPVGELKAKSQNDIKNVFNNTLSNALIPLTTKVVNKAELPKKITSESVKGVPKKQKAYYVPDEKIVVSYLDKRTLSHEYGHHIDYSMANKEEQRLAKQVLGKTQAWSNQNLAFQGAFRKDKDNLKLNEEKLLAFREEFYERKVEQIKKRKYIYNVETYRVKIEDEGIEAISDIFDAMTKGLAHSKYRLSGHGRSYYIERDGADVREAFAHLFSLQKNEKAMERINQYFPNLQKAFTQGLKDYVEE